jgi:hypothetical protein
VTRHGSPSLQGGDWGDCFWGSPRQKVRETLSQQISWLWWHTPAILCTQGRTNRRIEVQVSLGIKWGPISKVTNAKGLAEWRVQYLVLQNKQQQQQQKTSYRARHDGSYQKIPGICTWEAEIGRIVFQGQPGKNVSESPFSTNKPGVVLPVIPSTLEAENRTVVWGWIGLKTWDPSWKTVKAKKGLGHGLSGRAEALSSPAPQKKKKKELYI